MEVAIEVKKANTQVNKHEAGHVGSASLFNWRHFDPATLNGKDDLAVELTSYRDNLDALLKHPGEYVVIKGSEVIGIYRTQNAAMKAAFRFAPGPVLVKKIVEEEPVREVGHVVP